MDLTYEEIIASDIFTFEIGPRGKEYNVHGTAISRLSKPLHVLINGDMREAKEKRVKWLDVDEKTFVRFTEWAHTETYVTEEPEEVKEEPAGPETLDPSLTEPEALALATEAMPEGRESQEPLYSLKMASHAQSLGKDCCWNKNCASFGKKISKNNYQATCLLCLRAYCTSACKSCNSVYTDCPHCGSPGDATRNSCLNPTCGLGYGFYGGSGAYTGQTDDVRCLRCRTLYATRKCSCGSALSNCPDCGGLSKKSTFSRKQNLIRKFLNEITSNFSARKNKSAYEDYTEVFLCHAKLYVMADTYDIPALKQMTLRRLHATLKEFTLYPSRMNDIAVLAKYVFENTVPEDRIRDMITLYYACIVEDACKYDGLRSVIDGVPDFAFGLISMMSDRLA